MLILRLITLNRSRALSLSLSLSLSHTQTHTHAKTHTNTHTHTQCVTPLSRGSACSRDLYLHNTHISQRDRSQSMKPERFEPKIQASERLQDYALDRTLLGPLRISLILYTLSACINVGETWLSLTNC